jgi:hypothetical protein
MQDEISGDELFRLAQGYLGSQSARPHLVREFEKFKADLQEHQKPLKRVASHA